MSKRTLLKQVLRQNGCIIELISHSLNIHLDCGWSCVHFKCIECEFNLKGTNDEIIDHRPQEEITASQMYDLRRKQAKRPASVKFANIDGERRKTAANIIRHGLDKQKRYVILTFSHWFDVFCGDRMF